jgi:hypothetical protein
MRNPFRDEKRRMAYEWARKNHGQMMREGSGRANAYRRGYNYPDYAYPKDWGSYPFFAAGRDTARAIDALPTTIK